MVKLEHRPYNPLLKLKSITADVINTLGSEEAVSYITKYHHDGETGEVYYDTPSGKVKVCCDEKYVYLSWA